MCGPKTRSRSRKNPNTEKVDPKVARRRHRNGNNRSRKLQTGMYSHVRGAKASSEIHA